MAHGHFVNAVLIARIYLLRSAEEVCNIALCQVMIFPQTAEDLIVRFDSCHHQLCFYVILLFYPHHIRCIYFTPKIVYPFKRPFPPCKWSGLAGAPYAKQQLFTAPMQEKWTMIYYV